MSPDQLSGALWDFQDGFLGSPDVSCMGKSYLLLASLSHGLDSGVLVLQATGP